MMKAKKAWQPRCEYFAEAGDSKPGEQECADKVTTVVHAMVQGHPDIIYACHYHASMMAAEEGFIGMEPAPWLKQEAK